MKTKILTAFAIILTSFMGIQAQSINNPDDFEEVSISLPATVYLSTGSTSIRFEGDSEDIEKLETEIKNGKLNIRRKGNSKWGWSDDMDEIKIYISTPRLNSVNLSGSGTIKGESTFKTDNMRISLSGSGDIILEVESENIKVDLAGSGDITLSGSAREATAKVAGSGDIDMKKIKVETMDISIAGSGDIVAWVTGTLNCNISGSGDVEYKGNPEKVNSKTMGSGSVEAINN
ncbi:DUF2807 domain-containing protein [Mangrovivirga sp. M17]|uniref:DUF2807 domain-containing protein n=1 Tax=Mangrovivirga halotolerans TaxID=2993936 RepID=A0ABT3RM19_9BACT|nr:head GIN domain-containing protein [Mangrovivirga halotolerans]MCX2742865.1 DUF2807 domain-containing protein [Mangrovivirga halotolerans]